MESSYRTPAILPMLLVATCVTGIAHAAPDSPAGAPAVPSDCPVQKLHADDAAANAGFGRAAFVAGDAAFVGDPTEQGPGSVYVFARAGGLWAQAQKLTPATSPQGAEFGYAVAFDDSTAIIGAPFTTLTNDGLRHQGAAYVFTKAGGIWTETQELTASDFAAENQFGNAVAISGDTILVAAYNAAIGDNAYQGAAYVFTRSGDTWTEAQKLTASDGAGGDDFGYAVGLAGTTAVIGSPYAGGPNAMQGAAYVFTSNGGTWSETQKLLAGDGQSFDDFGAALAFDGTALAIGAEYAAVGNNVGQGAAYVFTADAGTWIQAARISSSDGAASDAFGMSISLAGKTIVAGAPFATVGDNLGQGAAYVFRGAGAGWNEATKLVADDGAPGDDFGYVVATDGAYAFAGSPFAAIGTDSAAGAAYAYAPAVDDAIFADGFDGAP